MSCSGRLLKQLFEISGTWDETEVAHSIQTSGPVVDIRFSTYEQPKSEVVVTISLGETRVKQGVLQSKTQRGWVPVSALKCFRHDGASWVEITTFEVDTAAGVIRIRTSHFSLFRAAAPETHVVTGLTSSTPESPASTFRTWSATVLFRWTPALGDDTPSIRYRLQVSTSAGFGTIAQETANVVETSATLTLPANFGYYWRVISSDASGDSLISTQVRLVIVDTAPPVLGAAQFPADTFPKIATRNATRIAWGAASDSDYIDTYRLKIWRGDTSGAIVIDSPLSGSQVTAAVAALTPDTYVWVLYASDGVQNQATSAYRTFRVFRNGDVTEDGSVNAEDYFSLGRRFGGSVGGNLADLDQNGVLDRSDLLLFLSGGN